MISKLWRNVSQHWHLLTFLAGAVIATVIWVKDVSSYGGRILTLEQHQQNSSERLTRMDYNVQMIARKVGVKPLEKLDDDRR